MSNVRPRNPIAAICFYCSGKSCMAKLFVCEKNTKFRAIDERRQNTLIVRHFGKQSFRLPSFNSSDVNLQTPCHNISVQQQTL